MAPRHFSAFVVTALLLHWYGVDSAVGSTVYRRGLLSVPGMDDDDTAGEAMVEATTKDYREDLNQIMNLVVQKVTPVATRFVGDPHLSSKCSGALFRTFMSLRRLDSWAIKLVTASGFIPTGIVEGGLWNLGSYPQCVKTKAYDHSGNVDFTGKYCSLYFRPPKLLLERFVAGFNKIGELQGRKNYMVWPENVRNNSAGFRIGICVPSLCSAEEMEYIIYSMFSEYGARAEVKYCQVKEPTVLTPLQMGILSMYGFIIVLLIIGTSVDLYLRYRCKGYTKDSPLGIVPTVCVCFSIVSNTQKLLNTAIVKGSDRERLGFISGMKVLSAVWVILCHAYLCLQFDGVASFFDYVDFATSPQFVIYSNGFLAVSTFLFLSGFVLTYVTLKTKEKVTKQNPVALYFLGVSRRYVRITSPALMVLSFFLLFPLFVEGPFIPSFVGMIVDACYENWWTVLLHINNFNMSENICLLHFWYISTDMQIFVFALIVVLIFIRYPKVGFFLGGLATVVFTIGVGIQTYVNDYFPLVVFTDPDYERSIETAENVYTLPFTHVGTFYIGLICAHCVLKYEKVEIHWVIQAFLWFFSMAINATILFVPLQWNIHGYKSSKDVVGAVYAALHRTFWGLSLFWLTYACYTGRAGLLNRFLSWKGFIVPGRLTYSVYLIHYVVYLAKLGILFTLPQISHFLMFKDGLGIAFMSFMFAYILFLTCEAPVANLDKLIFEPSSRRRKKSVSNGVQNGKSNKDSNGLHSPVTIKTLTLHELEQNGKTENQSNPEKETNTTNDMNSEKSYL